MFKKRLKNIKVFFEKRSEGSSRSHTTAPSSHKELYEHLIRLHEKYGTLVIEHMGKEGDIHVTTKETIKYNNQEDKIHEISDAIRSFIKGQANSMEAYAVFVDSQLKGVFGEENHAKLKKRSLISAGVDEEKVVIKAIEINSFKDFNLN